MRGHATIFETSVYISIFRAGLQDTGGPWHLKKFVQKLILSPLATFWKSKKKIAFYIPT